MALPAHLILFTFIGHLQISFGQQFKVSTSQSVEANKLAELQQQSLNTNTESSIIAQSIENIAQIPNFQTDRDYYKSNLNKTATTYLNGGTIQNIKYLRNQVYDVPAALLPVLNRNPLASQLSSGNFIRTISSTSPNADQLNIATGQTTSVNTENETVSREPIFISYESQPQIIKPSQFSYLGSGQPILTSVQFVPNFKTLQSTASPPQKQVSPQTFSLPIQPSNIKNEAILQKAHPPPAVVPSQTTMDDTIKSGHSLTSLLLSHLLSQSTSVQDTSTPVVDYCPSKSSKSSSIKTLLPLLIDLVNERKNNCCQCGKSRAYNRQQRKMDDRFGVKSLEIDSEPDTDSVEHSDYKSKNKESKTHHDGNVEEEYYSDEYSDYSAENYDDD